MREEDCGIRRTWLSTRLAHQTEEYVVSEAVLKVTLGKFHRVLQGMGIIVEPPFAGSTIRVDVPTISKLRLNSEKLLVV